MVKVITQETFDAVVKENVEEFGLDLKEARKDAVEQFTAQVIIIVLYFDRGILFFNPCYVRVLICQT